MSCIPLARPANPYLLICLDLVDFLTLYFEELCGGELGLTDLTDKNKDERAAFKHRDNKQNKVERDGSKDKGMEWRTQRNV